MAVPKLYPRATVKRIVKSHTRHALSKNADILVSIGASFVNRLPLLIAFSVQVVSRLHAFHARVSRDRSSYNRWR